MGAVRGGFLCVLLFTIIWKPAFSEDKCSIGCKGSASGASFLSNHKYNYAVEGDVSVFLTGAEKQSTNVKLNAQVTVTALGNCAHVLRVQSVQITGPGGKKYNKPPGIEKPVRFTLQDGRVGPEICAEEGDTRRALNIKRAVISLLQSPTKQATETDIFGICPTDVSSSEEGGSVLLHRSRDLSRCGMREQGRHDLYTGVFDPQAEIKNTQVLQSVLNVESKVKNGVPEKVSATEVYLYKPFSVGQNGARAKVHTKLTLSGQSSGTDNGKFTDVRTIIFENPHGIKLEQSNLQTASQSLKDTAKTLHKEASSKSAGEFAQFVRILRLTSKEDLTKLYGQVKGNNLERRVFLDGLLRAGTGASIETSIQLLKNKDLNGVEQKLVFLALGNAKHVTDEALKAAASLLDLPNIPKEVFLGVGALAGTYCGAHRCHGKGSQAPGIAALSQKLAGKLHNCKPKNKVEEDYVVAALKGIRSIRHIEDSLIDRLAQCVTDKNVKARVKVAALEAFRADPCAAKLKKVAIDTMKNRQLDSEIRIKAYLAVIDCPCGKSANEIKTLLDSEPVHQVNRFISTSLRHIRASSNPDKQLAKQHYGLIRTPNTYDVDDRKYSFYREASFDNDALGIGGSVEETVIYSQDSFLPRSASLNLTAELFGHSLNVLEVGGRQGNLDRVIEHFIGPKGYFNAHSGQEIYDTLREEYSSLKSSISRRKRNIKQDIDNFDKQVKEESAPYNNELDLDIYVKLFGTDAVFLSLGDDKGFNTKNIVNEIMKYVSSGVKSAKHFQQELQGHLLFLDAELAYPTSTGFALKLDLIGAATGRLEASTNVDLEQIYRDPRNAKVDIKLVPSTDIEVAGLFLIDADAVATGLKVVSNLHSSTGGHFIAKVLENGQGIDIQFGLPLEKQEIITASNELVYVTREKGQKEKTVPLKIETDRKDYNACFDQLSGIIGLTLCCEMNLPFSVSGNEVQSSLQKFAALYPLTGPAKIKLVLEKGDLSGYHIKYLMHRSEGKRGFEMLFEVEGGPSSKTAIKGELIDTQEEKTILFALQSPIKTVEGQLSLITKPTEYVALAKGKLDQEEYFGKVGVAVQSSGQRSVYRPTVEYKMPGTEKKSIKIDGQIIQEGTGRQGKFNFNGIKINLPSSNEVVDINGQLTLDPLSLEMKAKKGDHNAVIKANYNNKDLNLLFTNTLNPNINFKLNGKFDNVKYDHNINEIDIFYGGDLKSDVQRITVTQFFKSEGRSDRVVSKNKISIPIFPILLKVDLTLPFTGYSKIDLEAEGKYFDKFAKIDLKTRKQDSGEYNAKLEAQVLNNGVEVFAKRQLVDQYKSNFENYIAIKNFGRYELSGIVDHKTKSNDFNIGANGHLKLRTGKQQQDLKIEFGAQSNPKVHASHLKLTTEKELVNYNLKINRGANANGEFKIALIDEIIANGQFKITDNDGKGNGGFILHFKKADRKYKGDVKFVAKEPVFNADVDIFLNFGKDDNDKIHFSTNNKRTEKLLDTKNHVVYGGKKTEVNVKAEGEVGAKSHVLAELVLPTERVLSLKFDKNNQDKDKELHRTAEIELGDAPKRNAQGSKITYRGKYDHDESKNFINYEGEFGINLKGGKDLVQTILLKNSPTSDKKYKAEYKYELKGKWMEAPLTSSGYIDYDDEDVTSLVDNKAKYLLKVNYGDKLNFNWDGKYEVALLDEGDKKYQEDFIITLRLPFENVNKDIKLTSNILLLLPENKDVLLDYSVSQAAQYNGQDYKVDASGKVGKKEGFNKIKVFIPHEEPFSLDTSYKTSIEGEAKKGQVDVKTNYGKGKSANIHVSGSALSNREYTLDVKAQAPQAEKLKKLAFTVHTKNPSPDTYSVNGVVDVDGQSAQGDLLVGYSGSNRVVDLKYNLPNSKPARLYIKSTTVANNHVSAELKVVNIRDMNIDATAEGIKEDEKISFDLGVNSANFNLKNYKFKAASTGDTGSGKRLELNIENDGKNVLSGSTSFISKQEGPKTIIEGSGSVKVENQQKSATIKYIRTILTEGNEQGVEAFMNLAIGERSYVFESRQTNLEFKTAYLYCEEKKQCAHAEFNSKVQNSNEQFQHTVNILLDLRKLGIEPEFGLLWKNELTNQYHMISSLNVHLNQADKKYHLHVYNKPRTGGHIGYESGVTMELPKRTIGVESVFTAGSKNLPFPLNAEVTAYLDKNKPNQKLSAKLNMDLVGDSKQHTFKTDVKFHHPKIPQDTGFHVHGNLRHESYDNFMFEGVASVTQEGQSKVVLDVKPNHLKFLVQTPIVKVIDAEGSVTIKENLQEGNFKFSLLEGKPVQMRAVAKDYKYFEFTTGYTEDAQRKLSIIGHIDVDKRVDISADIVLPGAKKNIGRAALFIKDDLLKTDYGASKENFDYFTKALYTDIEKLQERVKKLAENTQIEMKKRLDRYKNSLKKIGEEYQKELESLKHELVNDETLQQLDKAVHKIVHFFAIIIEDIARVTGTLASTINKVIVETWEKVYEVYEKQLKPELQKTYDALVPIIRSYTDAVIDVIAHFAALVTEFVEKHKPELKELTDALTGIFKSLTRIIIEKLKEFRLMSTNIIMDLIEEIKQMPALAMIKEKIAELVVPERLVELVNEIYEYIKLSLPTSESKQLGEAIVKYLEKKIRNEKVNEEAELKIIAEKAAVALSSVLDFIKQQLSSLGVPAMLNLNFIPSFSSPGQSWPTFGVSSSCSILNQLLTGEILNPLAYIKSYRPRSFNPLDEIPAKLRAVVVNGQHIFTFDGSHLTFPGNCRYVLAHDHVDRNFTLVIELKGGLPKAIAIEDKSGTVLEVKENGQLTVNGANHGFPSLGKDVTAVRRTNGHVKITSTHGLTVECSSKLTVCYVEVSGFYLGKLRGLLGNGNNEPYDDFKLPNGKIVTSPAEFGHAYRLTGSCPQVKLPEHSHHQLHAAALPAECEEVFGSSSPLWPLSMFLNVAPFRQACIHAVAGNKAHAQQEACDIAKGYAVLATTGLLPTVMPSVCVQCSDADGPKKIGDEYKLTVPTKQADVIVLVETTVGNAKTYKDLVVPVVSEVVDSLKQKHIDDIKVHLVGISAEFSEPILFDIENVKLKGSKIEFPDKSRYKPFFEHVNYFDVPINHFVEGVSDVLTNLRMWMGASNVQRAYTKVLDLPLRAGATKTIINVVTEKCKRNFAIVEFARMLVVGTAMDMDGITFNLITDGEDAHPPEELIGYNSASLVKIGDKTHEKDTEDERKQTNVPSDACIDFAQNTGGMIFLANNFEKNQGSQKEFIQTTAQVIVDRMTRYQRVQDCVCSYVDTFHAKSVCFKSSEKEAASRRK